MVEKLKKYIDENLSKEVIVKFNRFRYGQENASCTIFIDEDKDIILNYNTQSKEKYINKIHELKDKYKIIEFNDFVMENSDLSQEELENKFKEMTNNRIHINMIFDKDSIFSDIEYVDKYFNNEQKD